MGLAQRKVEYLFPPEEYLEFERQAETRHEYIDGEIYAMAGESDEHADICMSFGLILGAHFKGKKCRVRMKDTKVQSGVEKKTVFQKFNYQPKGLFSYPDLVVICGTPEHHDKFKDVVTNPQVIIEVLSESTEKFDRDVKFQRYQKHNPTLSDYLLVSQDQPRIEHFIRQADNSWIYKTYEGLDAVLIIDSIECEVKLIDVYDRIEFETEREL